MKRLSALILIIFALFWQALVWLGLLPVHKVPSPWQIIYAFASLCTDGLPTGFQLHRHAIESLLRVFYGFSLATALGIPLGILMGFSKSIRTILNPFVEIIRPIPPLAWIPLAILWFGIGMKSAAFIIFLGAFFPILINTISGVLLVDIRLIEAALVLGGQKKDILLKILTPGALPSILTGLRIGLGIGWMTLVAAEFTGVKSGFGLGYLIMIARDIQRPDYVMAGMVMIGFIGFVLDMLLRRIESRLLEWM